MQTYSAKIRLAGSLYNEVQRADLTAPEISILKRIHGSDGVVEIKPAKAVERTDEEERSRLTSTYGRAIANIKGVGTIETIIGPEGVPLAKSVSGVDSLPPPKVGKRAEKSDVKPEAPAEPIAETDFS